MGERIPIRAVLLLATTALATPAAAANKEVRRLEACREVISELAGIKEGVPRDLFDAAECVVVIPGVKKAALGLGGRFGYGAALCRGAGGVGWGAPLMMSLKGGSFGLQIGGEEIDLVLLVMNPKGIDNLLRSKFTLGADASVAAGPIGRTAAAGTDLRMRAEILSYSRSRGIFAGLALDGAVLKPDRKAVHSVYGEDVAARDLLLRSGYPTPAAGRGLVSELERLSPRRAQR
jgi:lipid-binding SYLF domain-containing protein